MCKVAAVNKITDKNRENVWTFMMLLGNLISQGNNTGLGYAALDSKGQLFGEKWLVNETAFQDLSIIPKVNATNIKNIYACFGKVNREDAIGIIMHTRAATCEVNIENTHPFVNDKDNPTIATLHNGIIHNHMQFEKKYSTCDSEILVHMYDKFKVASDIGNINKYIKQIHGWYTALNLTVRPDETPIMDVYSDTGMFASYYIKELETRIWSSSAQDVYKVAQALSLTAVDPKQLKRGVAMRINVDTGEAISTMRLAQGYEPVRVIAAPQGNVRIMQGNLDDAEFRKKYFRGFLKEEETVTTDDTQPNWDDIGYIY